MYNLIPLKSQPNQTFEFTIEVDGNNASYIGKLNYRDVIGYWTLDILEYKTKKIILTNVPLLTGGSLGLTANIFRQLDFMMLGRAYVLKVSDTDNDYPDFESLQEKFTFVWGDSYVY